MVVEELGRIPDLLHPTPITRIDVDHTKVAMAMAFASGVSGGLFADALDKAKVAPSTWQPASFANDLFLQSFVALCFKVQIQRARRGAVPRTTSSTCWRIRRPIRRSSTIAGRSSPSSPPPLPCGKSSSGCTSRCAGSGRCSRGRRGSASGTRTGGSSTSSSSPRRFIDCMAEGFATARSGLATLGRVRPARARRGARTSRSPICSATDDRLATLDLKVCVGADGRIRGFEILAIKGERGEPVRQLDLAPVAREDRALRPRVPLRRRRGDGAPHRRRVRRAAGRARAPRAAARDVELYLGTLGFHDMARAAGSRCRSPSFVGSGRAAHAPRALQIRCSSRTGVQAVPCDSRDRSPRHPRCS